MRHAVIIASIALATAPGTAIAADRCAGLRQSGGHAAHRADASLVSRVGRQHVTADEIGPALAEGDWRVVFATPSNAERGVFFFKRGAGQRFRLIDVWGGVIPPDERASTIKWIAAHYHQPPMLLTACVVDTVIAGK